ncbi:thiol-disulfide isomerase [Pelistega indica]|uniref:Thiol-disulfide isomerase n=1 Tax=Pelistega indica TaxID=1414851 RepID=V8G5N7_9BURK|nr:MULTISPECIES: thioredoxin family protein [Pelistega]ETD70967.1 thiol-disulfide isomerase [Pelistega indica]
MLITNVNEDITTVKNLLKKATGLTIACYCAQWCGTCKTYANDFKSLSEQFPEYTFIWIDIEDNPELLDDLDVENFPTILIQQSQQNYFFGTMLPHIQHLERLIRSIQKDILEQKITPIQDGPNNLYELLSN